MPRSTPRGPRRHAVVIGINRYPRIPGGDLRGCLNDAALIERLLVERFAFAPGDVCLLRDTEATRGAIRGAFAELEKRLGDNDVAVVYFAGHGSRFRDRRRPGHYLESLVPYDSGRGEHPNRDLPDFEIDRWVGRWNVRTPHVALILDCCHSGAATRHAGADAGIREAPVDERDVAEAPGEGLDEPGEDAREDGTAEPRGPSGWLPGSHRAVLLAACRGEEFAGEHRLFRGGRILHHGAFTWFLGQHLARAGGGLTWRAVHAAVAPRVSAVRQQQHPQIEGRADLLVCGTREVTPASHLGVTRIDADGVELAGGAAHGLWPGARFAIRPAGSDDERGSEGSEDELARVRVTEVGATRSRAVLEAPPQSQLQAGQWAFERAAAEDPETRYHRLLALENTDPASRLAGRVELSVRGVDGVERTVFQAGERAEIVLVHHHAAPLFLHLLEFGLDGEIKVLLPRSGHPTYRPGGVRLAPGVALSLAADYYHLDPRYRAEVAGGLVLRPPAAGAATTGSRATLHLKLFATTAPADFEFLAQPASRSAGVEDALTRLEDWTTVTVTVTVVEPTFTAENAAQEPRRP